MYDSMREHLNSQLQEIETAGLWKGERVLTSSQNAHIEVNGKRVQIFLPADRCGIVLDRRQHHRKQCRSGSSRSIDGSKVSQMHRWESRVARRWKDFLRDVRAVTPSPTLRVGIDWDHRSIRQECLP